MAVNWSERGDQTAYALSFTYSEYAYVNECESDCKVQAINLTEFEIELVLFGLTKISSCKQYAEDMSDSDHWLQVYPSCPPKLKKIFNFKQISDLILTEEKESEVCVVHLANFWIYEFTAHQLTQVQHSPIFNAPVFHWYPPEQPCAPHSLLLA